MTAVIVQARLDSSRLPGKALLPLGGEPLVLRVMEALRLIRAEVHVIACPEDCESAFAPYASRAGFKIFAGPKEDVLARYCGAVRKYGLDKEDGARVIRATGDNPFVFADAARALNDEAEALNADYAGYAGLPYGAGVESVSVRSLLKAEAEARSDFEREHVCPYLYGHPGLFALHRPLAPLRWQGPELRFTVDTKEDYEAAAKLYAALEPEGGGQGSGERLIRAARSSLSPPICR